MNMVPPVAEFDLCSQEFKQDPFPTLAKMRGLGPLVRTRFPFFGNVWMATTYDAVNDLLRDHHRFVQNPATAGNRWMRTVLRWLPRTLQPLTTNMLLRDEPDHRRLRSLVDRAFQARSVEALRPRLEVLADEALNRLAEEAAASPDGVDLLTHFARPFPLAVICELLGLPPEDRAKFTHWANAFSKSSTLMGITYGLWGLGKLMRYLRDEIKRQARQPRDGLLAALIQAEEAGDRLTEDELVAMAFLLLAAGHETTLHQIACSVLTLSITKTNSASWPPIGAWPSRPSTNFSVTSRLHKYPSHATPAKTRNSVAFRFAAVKCSLPAWPPPTPMVLALKIPTGLICAALHNAIWPSEPEFTFAWEPRSPELRPRSRCGASLRDFLESGLRFPGPKSATAADLARAASWPYL
jgi:hypothetical protein